MNGLFSNYWSMPATPQQNVASYLRMPVMNVPQQKQYPSVGEVVQAMQPPPDNSFANNPAIRHIAGLPQAQPQQTQPSQTELMLQRISGYNGNTTS